MAFPTGTGESMGIRRQNRGFTLIELLIVMAVIAILLTLVSPRYFDSVQRSKEAVLKEDLKTLRDVIDKYHGDTGRYPEQLRDLVVDKYIREIPIDPVTGSSETWVLVPPEQGSGIYDVRSGAPGKARDGSAYQAW